MLTDFRMFKQDFIKKKEFVQILATLLTQGYKLTYTESWAISDFKFYSLTNMVKILSPSDTLSESNFTYTLIIIENFNCVVIAKEMII